MVDEVRRNKLEFLGCDRKISFRNTTFLFKGNVSYEATSGGRIPI